MSLTTMTIEWLEKGGWKATVVERWIPHTRIRKDCFGGDILAVHPAAKRTLLIQLTDGSNHSHRRVKALANPEVMDWIAAGNQFAVFSWKKAGPRGKKEWTLRTEYLEYNPAVRSRE